MIARMLTAALAAGSLAYAAHAAGPPASAFARLPAVEAPALSPDGSRIAQLERNESGAFLVVRSVPDLAPLAVVNTSNTTARDVLWADDEVVIVIASDTSSLSGIPVQLQFVAPFSVNLADGNRVRQLMRPPRPRAGSTIIGGGAFTTNTAHIVGREPATGRLLILAFVTEGFSLVAVDPRNDRREVVGAGLLTTHNWVVDESGTPIARVDYDDRSDRFTVRARRGNAWEAVTAETLAIPTTSVFGVDAAGDVVVGAELPDVGRFGLYALSLETGAVVRDYHVDDTYDVGEVLQDPYTNRVVGAVVETEKSTAVWFDDELEARQAEIDAALGGVAAMITSWSRDRQRFVVRLENGVEPTLFYLYDVAAAKLATIASAYPEAHALGIAPRYPIVYPARDGVQIPAYVTMLDGLPQPAPLVVLPHGGPETRDVGGFDWLAHFLASRGYVVVQPNFRGSGGYGMAWRDAGRGGWGTGVMQNDVTDAVQVFIEEGIADPDRVCIVGGSYGGYAALAGAVFTPELYRCAAAVAPVSDLDVMISAERAESSPGSWVVPYWKNVIGGDLGVARDRLAAISPAEHADRVQAPILLIHGREDTVVPISQSRRMKNALEDADKDVRLIELRGGDHWLSTAETRLATLQALESFLAEHLD